MDSKERKWRLERFEELNDRPTYWEICFQIGLNQDESELPPSQLYDEDLALEVRTLFALASCKHVERHEGVRGTLMAAFQYPDLCTDVKLIIGEAFLAYGWKCDEVQKALLNVIEYRQWDSFARITLINKMAKIVGMEETVSRTILAHDIPENEFDSYSAGNGYLARLGQYPFAKSEMLRMLKMRDGTNGNLHEISLALANNTGNDNHLINELLSFIVTPGPGYDPLKYCCCKSLVALLESSGHSEIVRQNILDLFNSKIMYPALYGCSCVSACLARFAGMQDDIKKMNIQHLNIYKGRNGARLVWALEKMVEEDEEIFNAFVTHLTSADYAMVYALTKSLTAGKAWNRLMGALAKMA